MTTQLGSQLLDEQCIGASVFIIGAFRDVRVRPLRVLEALGMYRDEMYEPGTGCQAIYTSVVIGRVREPVRATRECMHESLTRCLLGRACMSVICDPGGSLQLRSHASRNANKLTSV